MTYKKDVYIFKALKSQVAKCLQDMYLDIHEKGTPYHWMAKGNLWSLQEYWLSKEFLLKVRKAKAKRAPAKGCGVDYVDSTTL